MLTTGFLVHAHCAGAKFLKEAHVSVDGGIIKVSDFSCDASGRITSRDAMAKRATDVCGEICQFYFISAITCLLTL